MKASEWRTRFARMALAAGLLWLTGCSHSIIVEGTVPTPLIEPLPARVNVITQPAFNSYVHSEKLPRGGGTWRIEVGQLNQSFFNKLLNSLFEGVNYTAMENCGVPEAQPVELDCPDGSLRLELTEYAFLTPALSGLNVFSVSVKYQLSLMGKDGEPLGDWTVTGFGKSQSQAFQANKALNQASVEAIRDAGARIAIEWPRQDHVAAWIDQLVLDAEAKEQR